MDLKKRSRGYAGDSTLWARCSHITNLRLFLVLIVFVFLTGGAWAEVITVGPGQDLSFLRQVHWDRLKPGDEVRIKAKKEPYREKVILTRSGTRKKRIRITDIPDEAGRLPVIDGSNAFHFMARTDVLLSRRAIIFVGGAGLRIRPIL